MSRPAGAVLRVVLALVLVLLLVVQVLVLPGYAADAARGFPQTSSLEMPLLVLGIAAVACVQAAVVCVMALLGLIDEERIFEPLAVRYVDVFITATASASGLVLGAGVLTSATVGSTAWVLGALLALVGVAVALLMVQMRALLLQACTQHAELAGVV